MFVPGSIFSAGVEKKNPHSYNKRTEIIPGSKAMCKQIQFKETEVSYKMHVLTGVSHRPVTTGKCLP